MPWVKFSKDFDFMHQDKQSLTAFKKGHEVLVSQKAHDEAIEAGAAEAIDDPTEARAKNKKKDK